MNFSQVNFGYFALKFYGIFISLAFILASWYYYRRLSAQGFSKDFFLHHYWRWLLGGILLGRLFSVLLDPTIFDRFGLMSFFAFWDGEINFWGALLGFLMTMFLDLKREGKAVGPWLDAGMLPMLLAAMIADWGGFLTGKIYGTETNLPWGVQYETFGVEILNPVHPVTLYGFIAHLILWWWVKEHEKRWQKSPGVLSLKTLLYFLIIEFFLQFLRGNAMNEVYGLNFNQYLSLFVAFLVLYWLYGDRRFSAAIGRRIRRKKS
ncbi:hypothetical protein GW756_05140 [bacterium]|nr:hypothetical protein [Candidatus Peregrinibacteria bacterium]NCS96726.1 hypothetical protein [bacterium]